jgi:hypothetical protein
MLKLLGLAAGRIIDQFMAGITAFVQPPHLPPAAGEQKRLATLRSEFDSLNIPTERDESAAANAWSRNMRRLRTLVASSNPLKFLRWNVIRHTMFVGNAPYIGTEHRHLRTRPDWQERWYDAIRESAVGAPIPLLRDPRSSGTLVHHAYHLARFEESTGMAPWDADLVFEFGGGYGSMCRLVHALGFRGRYVISDLPTFSALQRYYLPGVGVPVRDAGSTDERTGVWCVPDMDAAEQLVRRFSTNARRALFIATWSLSETPLVVRERIEPLIHQFTGHLLAYQDRFGEVDNADYFTGLRQRIGDDVAWSDFEPEHLPGNRYLMGVRPAR